jgi:hypothetical protein
MDIENELKLIFVLKIGYNSDGEGLYEFIFSHDDENILVEEWCWDLAPACDHAIPPTKGFVDKKISLKTKSFDLFCLCDAVDREYMHGYHTIHALAFETQRMVEDEDGYDKLFDKSSNSELPLLVFHYGMSLTKIKELFEERRIILKKNEFIETSSIEL